MSDDGRDKKTIQQSGYQLRAMEQQVFCFGEVIDCSQSVERIRHPPVPVKWTLSRAFAAASQRKAKKDCQREDHLHRMRFGIEAVPTSPA